MDIQAQKPSDLLSLLQEALEINIRLEASNVTLSTLHQYNVLLDPDPVALGLSSLNVKISQIQQNKDTLCQVMFAIIDLKNDAENLLTRVEEFLAAKKAEAASNIPGLAEMKNQSMRDTAIAQTLKEELSSLSNITQLANQAKNNYQKVSFQVENLKSVNDNLKQQIHIVDQQIQINEIVRKS